MTTFLTVIVLLFKAVEVVVEWFLIGRCDDFGNELDKGLKRSAGDCSSNVVPIIILRENIYRAGFVFCRHRHF